jgi:mycothiol synthase
MDRDEIASVGALLDRAAAADGQRPLDGQRWPDLARSGRDGFAGVVAREEGEDVPVGYAQVTRDGAGWALDLVVDPRHRTPGGPAGEDLLRAALSVVASEGGGSVQLWVSRPTPETDRLAAAAGLAERRDLYQMRRPLPVEEEWALETRPFRPGVDDEAWLAVNNRAFAWHPEQGGWDRETLKAREAEPWFDPDGFLLHEERGRLAGFCWTKVHADHDPPLGEIYVIAVDPDWRGTGLGRRLVLAGLAHLAGKGLPVGMLYVDATNTPAVKLYGDLGFGIDHIDRAYRADVAAGPGAGRG